MENFRVLFDTISAPLAAIVFGCLIMALFLRSGARWVSRIDLPLGDAYFTVFVGAVLSLGIVVAVENGSVWMSTEMGPALRWSVVGALVFLVHCLLITWRLDIRFRESALVCVFLSGLVTFFMLTGAAAFVTAFAYTQ